MEPPPSALATANTYHDHMVDFVGQSSMLNMLWY